MRRDKSPEQRDKCRATAEERREIRREKREAFTLAAHKRGKRQ